MHSKPRKLAAEFSGSFVIVLASVAAVCGNQFLLGAHQSENIEAAASVAGISPLGIALAYGLAFACMTAAVGHISGGHFNPAISVGVWATRGLGTFDALTYCVVQLFGAALAAYVLRIAIPETIWRPVAMGTPELAGGITRGPGMLIEGLGTFVLTFAVCAMPNGRERLRRVLAALAAGLALTMASLFAAPLTGGALNPARAFGPALVAHEWTNHGVYWVGPLAGATLAAWICSVLFASSRPFPDFPAAQKQPADR